MDGKSVGCGHVPRVPLEASLPALPALRRCGHGGTADGAAAAVVAVPGHRRHGRGAAHRHAQSRDDRRTRRAGLARLRDGRPAARLRAVSRHGRAPVRHLQIRARLAARALSLVRHHAAVRRLRHHALRPAGAVGRHHGTPDRRAGRRWSGLSAGRRGPAYDADRRPRACDRPRAQGSAPQSGGAALRHANGRHGRECAGVRGAAGQFQRDPAHPGHPGRGPADPGGERRRALEAGARVGRR